MPSEKRVQIGVACGAPSHCRANQFGYWTAIEKEKKKRKRERVPIGRVRVYRSTTIALSMVLSHQNIKGGAGSQVHRFFSLPFVFLFLPFFPLLSLCCPSFSLVAPLSGTAFLHTTKRERKKKRGSPSIDRASLFYRSISNPLFAARSRVLPFRGEGGGHGSTFDAAFATLLSISALIWGLNDVSGADGADAEISRWILAFLVSNCSKKDFGIRTDGFWIFFFFFEA